MFISRSSNITKIQIPPEYDLHSIIWTQEPLQRECLGLYQSTRPCLLCVTQLMTDVCVHLLYNYIYNSSWKFFQLAARQLLGNSYGTGKAGGTAHPSLTKSHLPGHSPPASQAAVVLLFRCCYQCCDDCTKCPQSLVSLNLPIRS